MSLYFLWTWGTLECQALLDQRARESVPQVTAVKVVVLDMQSNYFILREKLGVVGSLPVIRNCASSGDCATQVSQHLQPVLMWVFSQSSYV